MIEAAMSVTPTRDKSPKPHSRNPSQIVNPNKTYSCPAQPNLGHVLEFLLASVRLYRIAQKTTSQIRGSNKDGLTHPSNTKENVSDVASATQVWNRLLENPASPQQEQTLSILQAALEDGLLDSILPYLVSYLNLNAAQSCKKGCRTPSPSSALHGSPSPSPKPASSPPSKSKFKLVNVSPRKYSSIYRDEKSKDGSNCSTEKQETLPDSVVSDCSSEEPKFMSSLSPTRVAPDRSSQLIIIHVCDEARGLRQDFTCPSDLLMEHIGYFTDVTAGQRLEDVDISVHCDVGIFEWLLAWVKKGHTEEHLPPVLEPKNAVSILISGDFLKMSPLVEEVLQYIHDNANLILDAQVNLNCLSDSLITRLSRVFTHWELESIQDPRDKLQNKLYARFVQALCDVIPSPGRGIYRTAATIFRCIDCGKVISKSAERLAQCIPLNTYITIKGEVYYSHKRDSAWNLTEHVKQLKTDIKTWRMVYWRLWGQVHFLPCSTCGSIFPACEMKLCRFHRVEPSPLCEPADQHSRVSTVGDIYPCCGATALKFSPLAVRNGCQFAEHTVQLARKEEDIWGPIPQIYDDLLSFQVLICLDPETFNASLPKIGPYWKNVCLIPPSKGERSFLDRTWIADHNKSARRTSLSTSTNSMAGAMAKESSNVGVWTSVSEMKGNSGFHGSAYSSRGLTTTDDSSSDEEDGGGHKDLSSKLKATLMKRAAKAKRTVTYQVVNEPIWRWDAARSTRHNQDVQRDRETKLFRELVAWFSFAPTSSQPDIPTTCNQKLNPKAGKHERKKEVSCPNLFDPGLYYKIENEFRERFGNTQVNQNNGAAATFRAKVQAISRIKMRLRNRAAFSACR